MKYNSVENAQQFVAEQIEWASTNGYKNFTIWSNGKELEAMVDDKDIATICMAGDLKSKGFWKAIQFVDGYRVEI